MNNPVLYGPWYRKVDNSPSTRWAAYFDILHCCDVGLVGCDSETDSFCCCHFDSNTHG